MSNDDIFEEADDIFYEDHEHQITDAEPDLFRRPASAHRGAAYLSDHNYPNGGASAGMEGGSMRPEQTIEVFGVNYGSGLDALGAGLGLSKKAAPRAGFVQRTTAQGRNYTALAVNKPKVGNHSSSIKNARDVGKNAVAVGQKLLSASKHSKSTKVHGAAPVRHVVSVRPGAKVPARKAKLSAAQIKKVAEETIKSGKALLKQADKHASLVKAANAKSQAAQKSVASKLAKVKVSKAAAPGAMKVSSSHAAAKASGASKNVASSHAATALRGDDYEHLSDYLGAYCDTMSDSILADAIGYTGPADGSDSPLPAGSGYNVDPTTGLPVDSGSGYDSSSGSDPSAYARDYDGEIADLMSQKPTVAPPMPADQYTADPFPGNPLSDGKMYSGGDLAALKGVFAYDNPGMVDGAVQSQKMNYAAGVGVWFDNGWHQGSASKYGDDALAIDPNNTSYMNNWGPLIGNPNKPEAAPLRTTVTSPGNPSSPAQVALWYYYDTAPARYRQAGDQQRLAQALTDWQAQVTALQTEKAQAALQDELDREQAEAQAKAWAQAQLAQQQQYDAEQSQAQHDVDVQNVYDQQQLSTDSAAQSAADEANAARDERQAELDAKMYERASEIDMANQERELEMMSRMADAGLPIDAAAVADGSVMSEVGPVSDQYADGGVDGGNDGGGASMDSDSMMDAAHEEGYEDQPTDVMGDNIDDDEIEVMGDEDISVLGDNTDDDGNLEVFGAMTASQRDRLKRYLKKIIGNPIEGDGGDDLHSVDEEVVYGDDIVMHASDEEVVYGDDESMRSVEEELIYGCDEGDSVPGERVTGAERIRSRRVSRR